MTFDHGKGRPLVHVLIVCLILIILDRLKRGRRHWHEIDCAGDRLFLGKTCRTIVSQSDAILARHIA